MSIVSQIALNLDILARNVARLQEQAAVLPPPDQIRLAVTSGSAASRLPSATVVPPSTTLPELSPVTRIGPGGT